MDPGGQIRKVAAQYRRTPFWYFDARSLQIRWNTKGLEAKTNVTLTYYLHYHGAYLPLSLILTDDREPLGQITVICHPGGN